MSNDVVTGGLKDLRLAAKVTFRKAEKDLGLAHGQLSYYERGLKRLPILLLAPMAARYNTTVTQVLAAAERDQMAREAREEAQEVSSR